MSDAVLVLLAVLLLACVCAALWLRMRMALPGGKARTLPRLMALALLLPVLPVLCGGGGIGKSAPKSPEIPKADPTPTPEKSADPEAANIRDAEARKLRQRRGAAGTVLTSPLGTIGQPQTVAGSVLGGMGG